LSIYLCRRSNICAEFASQQAFQNSCNDFRDVLLQAELFYVVQELRGDISGESCLALFNEGGVLFDVGVQIPEGRGI
jgi:hypothetical protein